MVNQPKHRKLSDEQAMLILNWHHSLDWGYTTIAATINFSTDRNVSIGLIERICRGITYRDIYDKYWEEKQNNPQHNN